MQLELKTCIYFRHSKICDQLTGVGNTDSYLLVQQKHIKNKLYSLVSLPTPLNVVFCSCFAEIPCLSSLEVLGHPLLSISVICGRCWLLRTLYFLPLQFSSQMLQMFRFCFLVALVSSGL